MEYTSITTPEHLRLKEDRERLKNWKRWGPYLPERQWGTVREDYSPKGEAWEDFPFEHAHARTYRWGEDGLLGWCDRECRLCFSPVLWNVKDAIFKERLFGLTGNEANHGEDVKELYYYLDGLPTHSYQKALYKYTQKPFPYELLKSVNRQRGKFESEYELLDTGLFDDNRYFDVFIEYAKAGPDDMAIKITVVNRGPEAAPIHVLPTLWFRNTWIWGCKHEGCTPKPSIKRLDNGQWQCDHVSLGRFYFWQDGAHLPHQSLFTENASNNQRLWNVPNLSKWVKDGIQRTIIQGESDVVNSAQIGTKASLWNAITLNPGEQREIICRLYAADKPEENPGAHVAEVFQQRKKEADAFFQTLIQAHPGAEAARACRQAYAGLLWTKQFYHYSVEDWLTGDPDMPTPPPEREKGRNKNWRQHLFNRDVISMPDKWEYPWYAAWDLAFHMIPFADIDPRFAKDQLILMLREWYMHPNGQLPAYEWAFDDVNPPVHAWACWRVYLKTQQDGVGDLDFLARVFHKLLLNFTWWVNRKDPDGNNIFGGGFLGLDNVGIFDRSKPLPGGGRLEQADGTAWMAFFCGNMLSISLELAKADKSYSDIASKFFEHFVTITDAINDFGGKGLWDEEEGFYFDMLRQSGGTTPLKIFSMVGLIPLLAVEVLDQSQIDSLPGFKKRMSWFLENRKDLANHISYMAPRGDGSGKRLLAIPSRQKLERVLKVMLRESDFLSNYGIRSLSKTHEKSPYVLNLNGVDHSVHYTPGDSDTYLFGGNSNWRGPVWFPINFLLIEALRKYHTFYGESLKLPFPTDSNNALNLNQIADSLSQRLSNLFLPNGEQGRPCHGEDARYHTDPHFKKWVLFYEFFHGDSGKGLGASHQTGWTALAAEWLKELP